MSLTLAECELIWYGAIEMSHRSFCTKNENAVNCPDLCPVDYEAEGQ